MLVREIVTEHLQKPCTRYTKMNRTEIDPSLVENHLVEDGEKERQTDREYENINNTTSFRQNEANR